MNGLPAKLKFLIFLATANMLLSGGIAYSQALEEVVVTAQKRDESLQDVPVSVFAVEGGNIEKQGIEGLADLSAQIPNVTVTEAAAGDQLFIRGVGSGINPGFEQSVGTFIDGVYFGRGRQSVTQFLDVQLVEVLKGPQSTYFGNNAIAGALNITTKKPGNELEYNLNATHEFNHNEYDVQGGIGGPITENFGVRIAGRYRDIEGWLSNTLLDRREPQKEAWALRATAVWTPTDAMEITGKVEYSELDELGNGFQTYLCPGVGPMPGFPGCAVALGNPLFEDEFDENSQTGALAPFPNDAFDPDNLVNTLDAFNAALEIDYDIGDHTLTLLTGYVEYDNLRGNVDVDFTPRAGIVAPRTEEFDQISQEIRLTSPIGNTLEYIVGGYFQSSDLFVLSNFQLGALPVGGGAIIDTIYNQEETSSAVFGAFTWNVSDRLRGTLGLRYTTVDKEVDGSAAVFELDNVTLQDAAGLGFLSNVPGFNGHPQYNYERDDDDFNPSVNIEYDATDDILLYASFAQGFKAGGFDAQQRNDPGSDPVAFRNVLAFDPEEVNAYEVGMKSTFFNGSVRANIALFRSEYSDLQVSTFDGVGGFNVGNAGEALTQGIELDLDWAATEQLTLGLALSILDTEYKDFDGQQCRFDRPVLSTTIPGTCNLTGEELLFAPSYSGVFNVEYVQPISNELELVFAGDFIFTDEYFAAADNDPNTIQDSYSKINVRVGLANFAQGWEIAIVGRNLTDEFTTSQANDLPQGAGSYFAFLERPRTVAIQFRLGF